MNSVPRRRFNEQPKRANELRAGWDKDTEHVADDIGNKQFFSRHKKLDQLVSDLMARRGYAQQRSDEQLGTVWKATVGPVLAQQSRAVAIKRGVLEVLVASSIIMQELTFQKTNLLRKLKLDNTTKSIRDIRFRVGAIQ